MLQQPFGYASYCDDIRQELGGKISLMGIYRADMRVPFFPITLPRFCIVATYCRPYEGEAPRPNNFEFRVWLPGTSPDAPPLKVVLPERDIGAIRLPNAAELLVEDPEAQPIVRIDLPVFIQPFVIPTPGKVRIRAFWNDEETRVSALRITRMDESPHDSAKPT